MQGGRGERCKTEQAVNMSGMIRFSPEINLGHLLTAATIVVTIGIGGVSAYVSVRNDIGTLHTEIANVRGDISSRLASDEQKAADTAHDFDLLRQDQHELAQQLGKAIDNFTEAVNEWRSMQTGRR
jgi:hypothetical protein